MKRHNMKSLRQYIPVLDLEFDAFEPAILHDLARQRLGDTHSNY